MVAVLDPERCRVCGKRARVIRSVRCDGYRRRRHQCETCLGADGELRRWSSYQSRLNPANAIAKIRAREAGVDLSATVPEPVGTGSQVVTERPRRARRRAKVSDYLSR